MGREKGLSLEEPDIFFSMIYNVIGLGLSVAGLMPPIIAVIFQEAGCVTVVVSKTLLLWAKGCPADQEHEALLGHIKRITRPGGGAT